MVFNRLFTRGIILCFFMFVAMPFVCAQEENFYFDTSGVQPRFFQRLSWVGDDYALYYEVAIEKENENGEYAEVLRERTEERFINVSLTAGYYRYSVIPLNLLGQPVEGSEWRMFEVIAAYMPSIEKFHPSVFFLDRYSKKELDIAGDNLLEESEIYLRNNDLRIYPVERTVLNKEWIKLFFDDQKLVPGIYEIYIKNPGGPETSAEGLSIGYRKPMDLFLKLSWIPVIPVYGEMYMSYGSEMYMTGAGLSFEAVSSARSSFNGGLEVSVSVLAINPMFSFENGFNGFVNGLTNGENGASYAEFDLNFIFQKQFMMKRMSVSFKLGVGVTAMNSSSLENSDGMLIHLNFGLSYLFLVREIFFIEAGVSLSHYFGFYSSGLIKPKLGIGWLF